ncbi:hypothetical protein BD779DRAFT_1474503 [Infundibulicybe gibba]|nr:hypothetical protein BD779DRAFT_1474503 [Infundibulicybe gibba]
MPNTFTGYIVIRNRGLEWFGLAPHHTPNSSALAASLRTSLDRANEVAGVHQVLGEEMWNGRRMRTCGCDGWTPSIPSFTVHLSIVRKETPNLVYERKALRDSFSNLAYESGRGKYAGGQADRHACVRNWGAWNDEGRTGKTSIQSDSLARGWVDGQRIITRLERSFTRKKTTTHLAGPFNRAQKHDNPADHAYLTCFVGVDLTIDSHSRKRARRGMEMEGVEHNGDGGASGGKGRACIRWQSKGAEVVDEIVCMVESGSTFESRIVGVRRVKIERNEFAFSDPSAWCNTIIYLWFHFLAGDLGHPLSNSVFIPPVSRVNLRAPIKNGTHDIYPPPTSEKISLVRPVAGSAGCLQESTSSAMSGNHDVMGCDTESFARGGWHTSNSDPIEHLTVRGFAYGWATSTIHIYEHGATFYDNGGRWETIFMDIGRRGWRL